MKSSSYILLVVIALIAISCAAKNSYDIQSESRTETKSIVVKQADLPAISTTMPISDLDIELPEFTISGALMEPELPVAENDGLKELFEEFEIPVTNTPRVQYYLNYYTGSGRQTMQSWVDRSARYMYIVKDIFEREGLPGDLAVLSFTESGFNPMAYSRAGAGGMWQFMPSTGRNYGLKITDWVDERRDFEKSTIAAAAHLKDLYKSFDDWYLAMAAYNAGSGRIRSATRKHRSTDFFTIASTHTLKLETRDYVPKYLAQLLIYKDLPKHGFTYPSDLPLLYDKVELSGQVNIAVIAHAVGCEPELMRALNPELRTYITPPVDNYTMRVPRGTKDATLAFLESPETDTLRYTIYRARPGELLAKIASTHRISIKDIQRLNSFPYPKVYTSKILFLPKSGAQMDDTDAVFAQDIARLAPKYYTVRKGDNMSMISERHNMPLSALINLNPKVNPKRIFPGQVLVISQGGLVG